MTGTVRSPDRAGVGGLHVVIVDRQIDRSVTLAETHTDLTSRYEVHFSARRLLECHKTKPDLQARVYVGATLLATSATRYNAAKSNNSCERAPTMHFNRELEQDENGDNGRLLHTSLVLLDLEAPSRERNQAL